MAYLPDLEIGLSLEQQLETRLLNDQLEKMSEQQIKELLLMTAKTIMLKDNIIQQLMRR